MVSIRMIAFCKNTNCPTSQTLLAFQTGEAKFTDHESIRRHLRECDFCSAEVEFYTRYPQADEPVENADIPPPMRELAEAILCSRHSGFKVLNELLMETDLKNLVKI